MDPASLPRLPRMPIPRRGSKPTSSDRHRRLLKLALSGLTILTSATLAVGPASTATAASAKTSSSKHHRRHRHHARADVACAGANASVGNTSAAVLRSAVVCLINEQRSVHHLPPLQASPLLDHSAQDWTNAMVSTDQFTHGANFAGRISAAGYVWRSAGENIATGYATPRTVVRAWMASTGHCQNILNPTYRNVGTGISPHPIKGWASGMGTWTQDFALGMRQSTPSGNFGPADGCPY
jgi:uncharacterized protein YkwD